MSVHAPTAVVRGGRFAVSGRSIHHAVGFAPELSSDDAGWDSLALYGWRGSCREADFAPFPEAVVVYHVGGAPRVPIRVGRRWDRHTQPGLLTVIPPDTRVGWDIRGEVHSRTVHLGPRLFQDEDGARPALGFRCGVQDALLVSAIQALETELRSPSQCGTLYADALATTMARHLLRDSQMLAPGDARGALAPRRLARVLERIEASLECGVSLQALAAEAALSRAYFSTAFRRSMGVTPHRYLTQRRLLRAQQLLGGSDLPLSQIAMRCGFSSQAHFTDYFRKAHGVTPSHYRRALA